MVRRIDVVVPASRLPEVDDVLDRCDGVHSKFVMRGETGSGASVMVSVRAVEKRAAGIVDALGRAGVGSRFGVVDIQELTMSKPRVSSRRPGEAKRPRQYRVDDRISLEEITQRVDDETHLTFDYVALVAAAAVLAGCGLLADSAVLVVASMLISPLIWPILGITLGIALGDRSMLGRSVRNEVIGVLVTVAVGLGMGLVVMGFDVEDWVGDEMLSRGTRSAILVGAVASVPSGVGVALATTSGSAVSALVGVAIAASLLPPLVNCGLCVVFGIGHEGEFGDEMMATAGVSAILFFVNLVVIVAVALVFFRIKGINARSFTGYEFARDEVSKTTAAGGGAATRADGSAGGEQPTVPSDSDEEEEEDDDDDAIDLEGGRRESGGGAAAARSSSELL